jgi:hypothetical protein
MQKSDTCTFGVGFLELLTGGRPVHLYFWIPFESFVGFVAVLHNGNLHAGLASPEPWEALCSPALEKRFFQFVIIFSNMHEKYVKLDIGTPCI